MENLGILITILGIVVVSAGAWALFQFAPKIQGMLDNSSLLDGADRDSSNKSLQPLYKVFYKFSHNSSDEWIKWILAEDRELQDIAFNKLKDYLEVPPEELGIATQEVIKAVTRFKFPNSFEILMSLLVNIRSQLGQLKVIDLFYAELCQSIIELDTNKGIPILKYELAVLNDKDKTDFALEDFKIMIVKALTSVKTVNDELREIYADIIINRNYSGLVRKALIRGIKDREDSVTQYIYMKALESHLDSSSQVLNKDHQTVLGELFHTFKHFIKANNKEIWDLLIRSCYNDSTQELFTELITTMVANPEESFQESQLLDILYSNEPIKDRFRGALIERCQVTKDEQSIFRSKLKPDDIHFDKSTIIIEKSKKTKVIAAELLPAYYSLEKALDQESTQVNKAERKAKHAISMLTGTGDQEKIYLLRGLAANTNRSFVYIDLPMMILCTTELNKLISTISNSKPSIVFLDNLLEVLKKELDMEEEIGLKHFLKSVKELAILPTVAFYAGLSISESRIIGEEGLATVINSRSKGTYSIFLNLDKPNAEARKAISDLLFEKITPSKIDASFSYDNLLEETEGLSLLEYLSFLISFLEKSLMIYGKVTKVQGVYDEAKYNEKSSTNCAVEEVLN
jgi:HEAT repeat protein